MLLFNCNLINPNPMMQNPRIIIGIDVNKEYTERTDVSETPKIIRIPPIINSLVFIFYFVRSIIRQKKSVKCNLYRLSEFHA